MTAPAAVLPSIDVRVGAGAGRLDEHRPGWWREGEIDVDRLDLQDGRCCPLGQQYGMFDDAPRDIAYDPAYGFYRSIPWPAPDASNDVWNEVARAIDAEYEALTVAWRTLILARRAGTSVTA